MTNNARIPQADITGIQGAVVKRFSKKMLGDVPESMGVMWHNRPVLRTMMGMRKSTKWNECDANLKSYAHMATMAMIGCQFCLDLGYFTAHNEGGSTWRKRARCQGGGSRTCSRRWNAT